MDNMNIQDYKLMMGVDSDGYEEDEDGFHNVSKKKLFYSNNS